jgi:uncharacterized protein YajQ (UPF0234 family)
MKPNTQKFTQEEYSPYTATYDFENGVITIDYNPEAIAFIMKDEIRLKSLFKTLNERMIKYGFNNSIKLIDDYQSIPEPSYKYDESCLCD